MAKRRYIRYGLITLVFIMVVYVGEHCSSTSSTNRNATDRDPSPNYWARQAEQRFRSLYSKHASHSKVSCRLKDGLHPIGQTGRQFEGTVVCHSDAFRSIDGRKEATVKVRCDRGGCEKGFDFTVGRIISEGSTAFWREHRTAQPFTSLNRILP